MLSIHKISGVDRGALAPFKRVIAWHAWHQSGNHPSISPSLDSLSRSRCQNCMHLFNMSTSPHTTMSALFLSMLGISLSNDDAVFLDALLCQIKRCHQSLLNTLSPRSTFPTLHISLSSSRSSFERPSPPCPPSASFLSRACVPSRIATLLK